MTKMNKTFLNTMKENFTIERFSIVSEFFMKALNANNFFLVLNLRNNEKE